MHRYSKVMFLLLCLMAVVTRVNANTIDRIVAVVNGQVILWSELQEKVRLAEREALGLDLTDPAVRNQMERAVLEQMIQEQLADQEVKRLNITVSESELNNAVAGIKAENGFTDAQFELMLQEQGLTMEQFRQEVRKQMERARLVDRVFKSKTIITDDQVEAYLKANPRATTASTEKYHLAIIFLPSSPAAGGADRGTADSILERLKKGEDFAKLAAQYSKGPAAEEGGDIGFIAAEELAPEIAAAVSGLNVGQVSPVVQGMGGHYILKVLDVRKDQMKLSDADVREKAKRELFQQEVSRKLEQWVRDLESKAFVDIRL